MTRKQTWWTKTKRKFSVSLKTLRTKTFSLLLTILAGFIIQFIWNGCMSFFNINGYDIHLFEAAILWMICL